MQPDAAGGPSFRLSRIIAVGWVLGVVLVYLLRYDAWALPIQLIHFVAATAPTLGIGAHFGTFFIGRLLDVACVLAVIALAFAAGATVLSRLIPEENLLGGLFALAVGLWLVAVVVLIIGAFDVRWAPLVFLGLFCWLAPAPREYFRRSSLPKLDGWSKLMLACLIVAALLNLPGTFAPPFEYDELEYHLGAPADYMRAGRIVFLPHNFYSNLPQLSEMLYLLTLVARSGVAAKLVHWTFGVLSALAVFAVGSRLWNRRTALTAAVLFYCVPFVQDLSQTARIDLATTFFATLTFGGLLMWQANEDGKPKTEGGWLWLSAMTAGAAVATKWPAVAVVLLPCVALVTASRRSLRLMAVFCLLSSVFVLPWLVKNWVLAGNPVYPLLYKVFPNPHWSPEQAGLFAQKHYPTFGMDAFSDIFRRIRDYSFAESGAVPLLLMVAPLILLSRNGDRSARRAGWLFVVAYAGWFLTTFRPWRFLFPAFPLAALVGAVAMESLNVDHFTRLVTRACVIVALALSVAFMTLKSLVDLEDETRDPAQLSFLRLAMGQVSSDEFVARMGHGTFEPVVWMNQHLPATAKVLYLGEARVFHATHRALWSTAFDQHPLTELMLQANSVDELCALMRQRGITHLYVNFSELERLQNGYSYLMEVDWSAVRHLLQLNAKIVHQSDRRIVYELK